MSYRLCRCMLVNVLNINVRYATHYTVLGVPLTASQKEIRDAYLELSKKEHPDKKTGDSKSHAKYLKINEAYAVLSRPASRSEYDQKLGLKPFQTHGSFSEHNPPGFQNWQDFKENTYNKSKSEYEGMHGPHGTGYEDSYKDDYYAPHRKEFYNRQRKIQMDIRAEEDRQRQEEFNNAVHTLLVLGLFGKAAFWIVALFSVIVVLANENRKKKNRRVGDAKRTQLQAEQKLQSSSHPKPAN